jgi:hypothetical protein
MILSTALNLVLVPTIYVVVNSLFRTKRMHHDDTPSSNGHGVPGEVQREPATI